MEKHFDVKLGLSVFQYIISNGERSQDEYLLDGIYAWSDFDGYNLKLRDEKVVLWIRFHNACKFEYRKKFDLQQFIEKLEKIDRIRSRSK